MTHSWPPPLSAIHTPGKAEQSKFPFPNKVRHAISCRTMPPAPLIFPTWALTKHVGSVLRLMPCWWPAPCVCQYPLPFPCLQPLQGYMVLFAYLLATALMLVCWSWVPHHKAEMQVSLVKCTGVMPSAGTCWDSWTDTSEHVQLLRVKKLLLSSIAPASFGFASPDFWWNVSGLRQALLIHWLLQSGLRSGRAYIPCYQPGFGSSFVREAGSPVLWCPDGATKVFAGEVFGLIRDEGHWSYWWSVETSSTIVCVS